MKPKINKIQAAKELLKRRKARSDLLEFYDYTFPEFIYGDHIKKLCDALERVERGECKRLIVSMPPRHSKLIAHNTPVLTSKGFKTHGELSIGDYVYTPEGKKVKIINVLEEDIADIKITFSNKEEIVCHGGHKWLVYDRFKGCEQRLMEAKDLLESNFIYNEGNKERSRYHLPLINPIEFRKQNLPLDPYFFGAWLGDGTSTDPQLTFMEEDSVHILSKIPYSVSSKMVHKDTKIPSFYFGYQGIMKKIRQLGCFKNKHIPKIYKFASIEQRLELLAGLTDTDGHTDKNSRVRIVTVSKVLAEDIREVAESLGFKPYIVIGKQQPDRMLNGHLIRSSRIFYQVGFSPNVSLPVTLERKKIKRFPVKRKVSIVDIKKVKPEMGKCITIDDPRGMYLVGKKLIPTHNSETCSVRFPAWFIGRHPKKRIVLASYSESIAADQSRKAKALFYSSEYRNLYPDIVPLFTSKEFKTSDKEWETKDRGNFYSVGIGGGLTGKGFDIGIIDDYVKDRQEANSETSRKHILEWYKSVFYTRQEPDSAIIIIATRWAVNDLIGSLLEDEKNGEGDEWEKIIMPAINEEGDALWEERFTVNKLSFIRKSIGIFEWSALYQGEPTLKEGNRFNMTAINIHEDIEDFPKAIYLRAWDLASSAKERDKDDPDSSVGVLATIIKNASGLEELWIKEIKMGKWEAPKRDEIILRTANRDGSRVSVYVEAFGAYKDAYTTLKRILIGRNIVRKSHLPGDKSTKAAGLEPIFEAGNVHIMRGPWIEAFQRQFLEFPFSKHDDIVDAVSIIYGEHHKEKGGLMIIN